MQTQLDKLLTTATLEVAWKQVKANKGAAGSDNIDCEEFEANLAHQLFCLREEILTGSYSPKPLRQLSIPKKDGTKRRLAIPAIRDRILHTALGDILEPILEKEFERHSYAYRPGRSYIQAINQIEKYRDQGYRWVIDADIDDYFDNVDHHRLFEQLRQLSIPESWLTLINTSLLTPQQDSPMPFGASYGQGLPQGSPLSPMLSNLYLDPLDEAMQELHHIMVRYADDFVVLCQSQAAAQSALQQINQKLTELKLSLNSDKTRVINFDKGFVFLGVCFIDQLVMPLAKQTERMMSENEGQLLALDETSLTTHEELPNQPNTDPDPVWLTTLPGPATACQTLIFDDPDDIEAYDEPATQEKLSLSQVSKLRSLYLQRQGSVVHKVHNRFEVKEKGERRQSIPAQTVDLILLFGAIHLTRATAAFCLQQAIPVVYLTQTGQYIGLLSSHQQWQPEITRAQTLMQLDDEVRLKLAKYSVGHKLSNCHGLLKRHQETIDPTLIIQLQQHRQSAQNASELDTLRGYEGIYARGYFKALQQIIPPQWQFTNRNRRPPKDPINTMLSYGYTLLFNNVLALGRVDLSRLFLQQFAEVLCKAEPMTCSCST